MAVELPSTTGSAFGNLEAEAIFDFHQVFIPVKLNPSSTYRWKRISNKIMGAMDISDPAINSGQRVFHRPCMAESPTVRT